MKICSKCNESKTLSHFHKDLTKPEGTYSSCIDCRKNVSKKYYQDNKFNLNQKSIAYQKTRRGKLVHKRALEKHKLTNKWKISQRNGVLRKYGLTEEGYVQMLKCQDYVCAICEQPETSMSRKGETKQLSVDHNHSTGKVRGLLCDSCNGLLGKAKDSKEILQKAIEYLENHV